MPSACGNVYWQQLRTNFTCALCQPRFDAVACPDRKIRSSISVASWADWNCAAKSRHAGECSGTSEDLHGVRRGPGLDREPLRPLVCDPGVTAIDVDLFRADAERRRRRAPEPALAIAERNPELRGAARVGRGRPAAPLDDGGLQLVDRLVLFRTRA